MIVEKVELDAIDEHGTLKPRRRHGLIEWKGSWEDLHYLILSEENDPPGVSMTPVQPPPL
jgi:hypothetical protein